MQVRAQVLIFSQFKIMLNVLEDYLRAAGFPFERIDGSVSQRDREAAINRYSKRARPAVPPMSAYSPSRQGDLWALRIRQGSTVPRSMCSPATLPCMRWEKCGSLWKGI